MTETISIGRVLNAWNVGVVRHGLRQVGVRRGLLPHRDGGGARGAVIAAPGRFH